jgi:hypothetical protein
MSTPVKAVLRALAFSGVFALAATLFLAYWIQEIGFHNNWWFRTELVKERTVMRLSSISSTDVSQTESQTISCLTHG